jgi:hypothetical protein
MKVISYFNKIPNSKFSSDSEEIISLWEKSWKKHHWNPIILNEEFSKRNKLYQELDIDNPDANFYKTINPEKWKYHRSCYCRLLAYCQYVRENGATLYADYDVMNYGFSPNILNFATENSYFCGERAVVYLGKEGTEQMEKALLQFSTDEFKEEGSSADVYVMERYTNIFIPVYNNLETNEKAKRSYYYVGHSYDYTQDDTLLVHYDGGVYRRGADRKLSRLQIINEHNRL